MKRTYHPRSWSEQARGRAIRLFNYVTDITDRNKKLGFYDEMGEYHENATPEQYVIHALNFSKPKIIRYRAAKRFGRMWRKYLAK